MLPPRAPVWFILGLVAALTIGFPLLFADRRESFLVEGSLIAAIAALVTAGLLLVWFLDHPYANEAGSIKPTEMVTSLGIVEDEQPDVVPPCDSAGSGAPSDIGLEHSGPIARRRSVQTRHRPLTATC